MSDVKCPYCFNPMDIPTDKPLEENFRYVKKCTSCKKNFIYYAFQTIHFVTEPIAEKYAGGK